MCDDDLDFDNLDEEVDDSAFEFGDDSDIADTDGDSVSFGGSCSHCDNDVKNTKYSWWVCKEN